MKNFISSQVFFLFLIFNVYSQDTFINPIINGGYPDPSIVRVENDFYIVNSSFEYFPALPIHHSKDLVNWELIGYGIDRPSQGTGKVNLYDVQQQGGIHAPSIRYHDGLFYIVTTNVYSPVDKSKPTEMVNFILTAKNPAGPWSDPYVIEGAPGIDPDIFFDDNGKVWFVCTHDTGNHNKNGIGEIWIQELDLDNWKLKGQRHSIWRGACGGCCVEGPHIYKQYGRYYLMVAEGGTSYNHAVMIASSENIEGPYDSNPKNPILTSRHLSNNNWVHSTGHADLVQLKDNRWYMVSLGIRNEMDSTSNMGRETHLMPVVWEEAWDNWVEVEKGRWEPVIIKWPVVAPNTGKVERNTSIPFFEKKQNINYSFYDDFIASNDEELQTFGEQIVDFLKITNQVSFLLENEYDINLRTALDIALVETILKKEDFDTVKFHLFSDSPQELLVDGFFTYDIYMFGSVVADSKGNLLDQNNNIYDLTLDNLKLNSNFRIRNVIHSYDEIFDDIKVLFEQTESPMGTEWHIDYGTFVFEDDLVRISKN